jgi:hypothetical protein
VGSGLILLVIVAAWLAVLVPMALRSHEASTSLSSVDRFSDAMRVLSRRDAAARRQARREADDDPLSAQAWAENEAWDAEAWDDTWDDEHAPGGWRERLGGWRSRAGALVGRLRLRWRQRPARRPSSPAARRRRLLVALVSLTLLSAVGGLVGPPVLLGVAGVLATAVALFVVQLRRLAVARAARARRGAPRTATRPAAARQVPAPLPAPAAATQPVVSTSVTVQPLDVHPVEPEVAAAPELEQPVASTAVRHDEPLPAAEPAPVPAPAAALGQAWSPVPVPVPTYVTAPVAPPRAPRIVDLTRPGAWSQEESPRPAEELPGGGPAGEPAVERRRAVNEW